MASSQLLKLCYSEGEIPYLKRSPHQPRYDPGSVSSLVGAVPCSTLKSKAACAATPAWNPCNW